MENIYWLKYLFYDATISNVVFHVKKMAFHSVLREAFISTLTKRWDHFKTTDVDIDCESAWSSLFLFFRGPQKRSQEHHNTWQFTPI